LAPARAPAASKNLPFRERELVDLLERELAAAADASTPSRPRS
jgi:hypothetical protein